MLRCAVVRKAVQKFQKPSVRVNWSGDPMERFRHGLENWWDSKGMVQKFWFAGLEIVKHLKLIRITWKVFQTALRIITEKEKSFESKNFWYKSGA